MVKEVAKIPESEKLRFPKTYVAYHIALEAGKYGSSLSLLASPIFFYWKQIPVLKTRIPKFFLKFTQRKLKLDVE